MKKILITFLCVIMVMVFMPTMAFAAENTVYVTNEEQLKQAVSTASNGDIIILKNDVTVSTTIYINKSVTLDLGGNTLAGQPDGSFVIYATSGEVVTKNGLITSTKGGVAANAGSLLLTEDLKVEAVSWGIYSFQNAVITIDKTASVKSTSNTGALVWGDIQGSTVLSPTLNVYGNVESTSVSGHAAIAGNGTDKTWTYINIYDGANVKSANGVAIFAPQGGDVNIYGGTIEGVSGVGIKSGNLAITGGKIKATATEYNEPESVGSGIKDDGSAILIDSHVGYVGAVKIIIDGNAKIESKAGYALREIGSDAGETNIVTLDIKNGTFISVSDKESILVREVTEDTVTITGGTFTTAPNAKYIADNYTTYEKAGKYTVGLAFKPPVADAGTEEVPTVPTETTVKNEMTTVITDIVTGVGTTAVDEKTANNIIAAVKANPTVVIKTEVVVEEVKAADVDEADVAQVEATVKKGEKIGQYFDLSLLIKAGDDPNPLGTLNKLSKPVKFTLDIPKELQDANNVFSIIRVHEGDPLVLPTTVDTKNWTISFETDSFSTYALTYTEKAPATEVPKTSDANNMLPWLTAMVLAAGAAVVLKRREN